MPDTLIIRLPDNASDGVTWIDISEQRVTDVPVVKGTLEEAAFAAVGHRVVCLVPTIEVLLTETALPTRNRQRILEAVPYALENQLAMDVENLHFAIEVERPPSDKVSVAVVDRTRMTQWMEQLGKAGIEPQVMLPDVLCLPWEQGTWTVLVDGDNALVRTGEHHGVSMDLCNFPSLIKRMLTDAGESRPARLDVLVCGDADIGISEAGLGEPPPRLNVHTCETDALNVLAGGCADLPPLNLLQGDYRIVQKHIQQLRPWIPALVLGGVLAILVIASNVVEYLHLQKEEQRLNQQIRSVFQTAFPDIKRVVKPKTQMQQKLAELRKASGRTGADFVTLLGRVAPPLGHETGATVDAINYRDGHLDLRLTLADLQGLERLKQQLMAQNLNVEIKSANAEGKQVSAHLRISRGES